MKKYKTVITILLVLSFLLPFSLHSSAERSELPQIGCVFGNFSEEDCELLMENLTQFGYEVSPEDLILFPVYFASEGLFTGTKEEFYKTACEQNTENTFILYMKEFLCSEEYGTEEWVYFHTGYSVTSRRYLKLDYPESLSWYIPNICREEILKHVEEDRNLKDFLSMYFQFPVWFFTFFTKPMRMFLSFARKRRWWNILL